MEDHIPTKLMDSTTIKPNLLKGNSMKVVTEQCIDAKSWQRVEEKTDTEEIIAYSVNSTLDENTTNQKGSTFYYLIRVIPLFYSVQLILLWCMVNGYQPLSMICLSIIVGFSFLGRNDTAMRIGIGYASIFFILVGFALDRLNECCDKGHCTALDYVIAVGPVCATAIIWGTLAGLGFNPGACSGLAIIDMTETAERRYLAFERVFPGTSEAFSGGKIHGEVFIYWLMMTMFALFGFVLSSKIAFKKAALFLVPLHACLLLADEFLNGIHLHMTYIFPPTVFLCYFLAVNTLPFGRELLPDQKPVGLQKIDLVNNLLRGHIPAILSGVLAGICLLGGRIVIESVNDCFVTIAILVFVSFLAKLSPISQYFLVKEQMPSPTAPFPTTNTVRHRPKKLHGCFKLLVRDFAGQMKFHCMHQPFLPRYGVFLCVFSWRRAGEISLKYAEGRNTPEDGPDECLKDTLFWLKNISMHRRHPNVNKPGNSSSEPNIMDRANIKNIFLVGTHAHYESCKVTVAEKKAIIMYYKEAIRQYTDIYTSIQFDVSETGVISVENRDDLIDDGIPLLKSHLINAAEEVISQCFPNPLPVYFWCWLKEKRDQFAQTNYAPYEMLSECHIDTGGKYRSVYPKYRFSEMINTFRDIGEIFLVRNDDSLSAAGEPTDYFVFFDIQFLIDFMKDMINVDEGKKRDRLKGDQWEQLDTTGKASIELLRQHLKTFYKSKGKVVLDEKCPLEKQPLVRSLLQLDFVFFVGDNFYLPQSLPPYNQISSKHCHFEEVRQMLWERVYDFQDFEFHHEYVFFRLLARCAMHDCCENIEICRNWASFKVRPDKDLEEWFTVSCEKKGVNRGRFNRIYLRTSQDYDRKKSLELLDAVTGRATA